MDEIVEGIFIEEKKNRFLCSVLVSGEAVECYVSSSCRLSNFLNMTGKKVFLRVVENSKARTKYSLFAVELKGKYALMDLKLVNRVVEQQLSRRLFAYIGKRSVIQREKRINDYKADLYLPETDSIVEIKSVISQERRANFPGVHSERAINQLKMIQALIADGYKVYYVIVSLIGDTRAIVIDDENEEYKRNFVKCLKAGMITKGYYAEYDGEDFFLRSGLKIEVTF